MLTVVGVRTRCFSLWERRPMTLRLSRDDLIGARVGRSRILSAGLLLVFPEPIAAIGSGLPRGHRSPRQPFQFNSLLNKFRQEIGVFLWGSQKLPEPHGMARARKLLVARVTILIISTSLGASKRRSARTLLISSVSCSRCSRQSVARRASPRFGGLRYKVL